MLYKIPVLGALTDCYLRFKVSRSVLCRSLWIHFGLFVLTSIWIAVNVEHGEHVLGMIGFIFQGLVIVGVQTITVRIMTNGEAEYTGWRMRETQFVIKGLLFGLIVGLVIVAMNFMVSFVIGMINGYREAGYEAGQMLLRPEVVCPIWIRVGVSVMVWIYLMMRLMMVLPAAALGRFLRFRDSWRLTRGNGLRLCVVMFGPAVILSVLFGVSVALIPDNFYILYAFKTIISIVMIVYAATVWAVTYERLMAVVKLSSP